ncbi:MAG: HigA family addiction module antidote protein [Gammaproteobacteria bacterium]|jgi:addiction module HigA family antidote|nr:HigA family addiction module antidote protein [Gammaproteobacteria bacterium]MBT4605416.1 HigA family addiction module antidote protein [Thiotrichales bacterium]MBT3473490.1 HigA family addiction module antidote protein [Gammaproteobacteria bacterium]MBT3967091.1 HigA family addiction module antidote protein [Gammaproteobacteria bacterium]MBT4080141.1 HigA family addiction module antidote protein [Gammaproteobacteria bacterium]
MIKRENLANTDFSDIVTGEKVLPIHPGIHLKDYIEGAGVTQYRVAKEIHVSAIRISEIVNGKRSISADTAIRLGRFFDTSAQFWMNLQSRYDLDVMVGEKDYNDITPVAA